MYATSNLQFNSQTSLHVAVVLSVGYQPQVYINGVWAMAAPYTMQTMITSTYFAVGNSYFSQSTLGMVGSVDEVRVWGGAMSAADIASHYQQGAGVYTIF